MLKPTAEELYNKNLSNYRYITRCLIGCLTKRGSKKRARNIFNSVIELLRFRVNEHPLIVLEQVLSSITPKVSLCIKKRGGSSYKLPYVISYKRGLSIAIHGLVKQARVRAEETIAECLVEEIIDIIKGRSSPLIKNVSDIHKTALFNRPFLRYWGK
jgi:small subunit ribosomal protein S7